MPTRKHFIAAAASVPLLAAAPPSAAPSPPVPSPSSSATKKKVSALARDFAARMREFDADLSDQQIEKIAASIDDNLKIGKNLNPKGRALKNSDEPATTFEVPS
jgi:hypothetical protein